MVKEKPGYKMAKGSISPRGRELAMSIGPPKRR